MKSFLLKGGLALLLVLGVGIMAAPAYAASARTPMHTTANAVRIAAPCHTVVRGDTLARIGAQMGVSWQSLATWNAISNPNLIFPGQVFCAAAKMASGTTQAPLAVVSGGTPQAIYHNAWFPNYGYPGYCVYYAQAVRSDLNLSGVGGAANITAVARSRGYQTGTVPAIGALVVYAPGVQGANTTYGHVGVVVSVLGNGQFYADSMASPTPWVVARHLSWTGPGVTFVYG